MARVTITTFVENAAGRADLRAEHGLAVWIDTGRHRVLFDIGAGSCCKRGSNTRADDHEDNR
jgi:metal-dependent hydrolase (beta-lactamase superfamily II)